MRGLRQATCELVQVAVRGHSQVLSRSVEPTTSMRAASSSRRAECTVVDLEEWDGPSRMLAEEVVVPVPRSHDLDLVHLRGRELDRRRLLEVDVQTENVAEEADHRLIPVGPDPDPADVTHLDLLRLVHRLRRRGLRRPSKALKGVPARKAFSDTSH